MKKLNIGAGKTYLEGYINIDVSDNGVSPNHWTGLVQKKLDEVILYPNPTHHLVHLPSHFKGTLSIFDLNGRSVLTTMVKGPSDQMVDVHHIEPGLYICRMIFDNGRILDKKLLIR